MNNRALIGLSAAAMSALVATAVGCGEPQQKTYTPAEEPAATVEAPATTEAETTETEAAEPEATEADKAEETTEAEGDKAEQAAPAEETKTDEKAEPAADKKAEEPAAEEAKSDDKAEQAAPAAEAGALTDGSYTAEGKGIGGAVPVTVEVKDGKVATVTVGDNSETQGIGSKAIEQLPEAIVEANGTEGVDAVSGATVTSKAIFTAVDEALEQAKGGAAAEQAAPADDAKADDKAATAAKDDKAADTKDAKADDKAAKDEKAADEKAEDTKADDKAAKDDKAADTKDAKADDKADAAAALTDGSYTAEGKGIGGAVPVTVEVKDGKVATVTVGDNSETQGIGSKAIEQLPEAIVEANGTEGVDAVSGATVTSKAIFTAVDEALEQAKGGAAAEQAAPADDAKADDKAATAAKDDKAADTKDAKADDKAAKDEKAADEKAEDTKADDKDDKAADTKDAKADDKADAAAALTDGEYTAEGKGIGGKVPVTVTVKDGKVSEVKVGDNSETQGIGSKAIEQLPDAIVKANGTEGVDAVSGATVTSKAIFTAVDEALEQAKGGAAAEQAAPADDAKADDKADKADEKKADDKAAKADEKAEPAAEAAKADEKAEPAAEETKADEKAAKAEDAKADEKKADDKDAKADEKAEPAAEEAKSDNKAAKDDKAADEKAEDTKADDKDDKAADTKDAKADDKADAAAALTDGEYTAEGKGIGGKVPVTVTVKDGKVSEVKVGDNSETQGIGSKAIEQLPDAIVKANGTEGVDAVSGATVTSKAIFSAVEDCLKQAAPAADDKAAKDDKAADAKADKAEAGSLKDGDYTAEGKGIGGKVPVTVTVKDGKVSEVKVGDNSETQGIGSKAIEQLPDAIVKANGTEGVDAVSGATVTSKAIFTAVEDCLKQAK